MKISALVLAKNEEEMIDSCLRQLDFAAEIIVLDQNSTDRTREIAKKYTSNILLATTGDFDENRNVLASHAKEEWLLYMDADERLTRESISEIKKAIEVDTYDAYYFPRKNYILGRWLKHGGWWPDYVPRLFKRKDFEGWFGRVHESPKVGGKRGYMKNPIEHFTGQTLTEMFSKTRVWAKVEAELAYEANHPKVNILRVVKAFLVEMIKRYFFKFGFLDGGVGLIEAIFQGYHRAIILVYLWELQNDTVSKFKKVAREV